MEYIGKDDSNIRIGAILGLGIAYAGSQKEEVGTSAYICVSLPHNLVLSFLSMLFLIFSLKCIYLLCWETPNHLLRSWSSQPLPWDWCLSVLAMKRLHSLLYLL
jgi:hypothetical protein